MRRATRLWSIVRIARTHQFASHVQIDGFERFDRLCIGDRSWPQDAHHRRERKQLKDVLKAYEVAALDTASLTCSGMAHGHISVQIKPSTNRKAIAKNDFKPYQFKLIGFSTVLNTPKADDPDDDKRGGDPVGQRFMGKSRPTFR